MLAKRTLDARVDLDDAEVWLMVAYFSVKTGSFRIVAVYATQRQIGQFVMDSSRLGD